MRQTTIFLAIAFIMALAGCSALAATSMWITTDPTGTPVTGDSISVTSGSSVQLYAFIDSTDIGNLFELMIGYDTSDAATYGAGVDTNSGGAKKLTLAGTKAGILASMPGGFTAFASAGFADAGVVLDASGREALNTLLGGRPYGFVARAGTTANGAPGRVVCCSFTLTNNMTVPGDSQYVVISNSPGGNSYSSAWKWGTSLCEGSYALRVVNTESTPLPVVGTSNKSVLDSLMTQAASKYEWVLWGRVSARDADGFVIDDGSGAPIQVVAPGNTVSDGDYVSVKGMLDVSVSPPTLTSEGVTPH